MSVVGTELSWQREGQTAMACAVGSSGALARYETVVLLTADEIDDAMKIAVSYAPPGGGNYRRAPRVAADMTSAA